MVRAWHHDDADLQRRDATLTLIWLSAAGTPSLPPQQLAQLLGNSWFGSEYFLSLPENEALKVGLKRKMVDATQRLEQMEASSLNAFWSGGIDQLLSTFPKA